MIGITVDTNYISNESKALYFDLIKDLGIDIDENAHPWVPIGNVGHILILGHYDLSKPVFEASNTRAYLIDKASYTTILKALLENQENIDSSLIESAEALFGEKSIINTKTKVPCSLKNYTEQDLIDLEQLSTGYPLIIDPTSILLKDLDPLPENIRKKFKAFTLNQSDKDLFICTATRNDIELKDQIISQSSKNVVILKTTVPQYEAYLDKLDLINKHKKRKSVQGALNSDGEKSSTSASRLKIDLSNCGHEDPFKNGLNSIEILQWIIYQAYIQEASDIHFEQANDQGRVRIRIDGELHTLLVCSLEEMQSLVNVSFDTCGVQREPNVDGSFVVELDNATIAIRMNSIPFRGSFPKVNFRILANDGKSISIEEAISREDHLKAFKRAISMPQGLILITGPTGSGKTTTLYACLEHINEPTKNIQTIEDPIERNVEGLNQSQVLNKRNITFANLMRSVLRQDPDVVLLGEMRDKESAELAVQAALTGHLVFSTLHANDALGGINRMLQIGIPTDLFADSLLLIQAQRLLKKLCPYCKVKRPLTKEELIIFQKYNVELESDHVFEAKKCQRCSEKGYIGRTAVMEIVQFTPQIADLVMRKQPIEAIKQYALKTGFEPLFLDALKKARGAEISIQEALKLQPAW